MEAKKKALPDEQDRKDFRRVTLQRQAKFTLEKSDRGWEDCTIINVNNNLKGIGIKFHACENIKVNSIVIIDLLVPDELVPVHVKGIVRWIERKKDYFIGGVELKGKNKKMCLFEELQ